MKANKKHTLQIIVFSTVMICFVLSTCFFILEYVVVRYYKADFIRAPFHPSLGWRMQPGTYRLKPEHTFSKIDFFINKLGLRNKEISDKKSDDTQRIIVLGDSYTFGFAVQFEELFTTKLEKALNINSNGEYEIINAGIPKYGTAQELMMMKYLKEHKATGDIYLLTMFTNDILDNLRLSQYSDMSVDPKQPGFILDENGSLILKYLPQRHLHKANVEKDHISDNTRPEDHIEKKQYNQGNRSFLEKFKSVEFLKDRIGTFLQTKPFLIKVLTWIGFDINFQRIPSVINGWYREDIVNIGVPLTKALVGEIKKEVDKNNAKLLVVLIPSAIQVKTDVFEPLLRNNYPDNKMVMDWLNDPLRPQRIIGQICKDLDIPYLDLLPILRAKSDEHLFIHGDWHFTPYGHMVTAEGLAGFIEQNVKGH